MLQTKTRFLGRHSGCATQMPASPTAIPSSARMEASARRFLCWHRMRKWRRVFAARASWASCATLVCSSHRRTVSLSLDGFPPRLLRTSMTCTSECRLSLVAQAAPIIREFSLTASLFFLLQFCERLPRRSAPECFKIAQVRVARIINDSVIAGSRAFHEHAPLPVPTSSAARMPRSRGYLLQRHGDHRY